MNKSFCLVFVCFLLMPLFVFASEDYDVRKLRKLFEKSEVDENIADQFYELLKDYQGKDPVILAYKAASNAVEAKYSWMPWEKKKHIDRSAKYFEKAVSLAPNHAEVRFLRYTIESLTPKYLNMSPHLAEDKQFLMQELRNYPQSSIKKETLPLVVNFFLKHIKLTASEKKLLQQLKS